jgi:hypothetical protein
LTTSFTLAGVLSVLFVTTIIVIVNFLEEKGLGQNQSRRRFCAAFPFVFIADK